ncbi:MAG: PQQ-binding-like beta-propeller repeat protein [Candidatus Bathyarchaeia archaeon]
MEKSKSKSIAILIAAFLAISMGTALLLTPSAYAHSPPLNIPTYAYVNAAPNPAGIGQTINVGFWLGLPPPTANGPYGDRWHNLTVIVTKPDGTNQTLGSFTSDDTGGTHTNFIPSTTGNYTFQMSFPGQTLAGNNLAPGTTSPFIGDYYQPSISAPFTLTVQQSAVPSKAQASLPANYWSRPIESVNSLWYTISGSWLGFGQSTFASTGQYNATASYNPYTTAPTTAHVMWTTPEALGGLIGGEFSTASSPATNFYSTSQYEPKFAPVVIAGILYYTQYPGASTNPAGIVAVDLQTGKTLWTDNAANLGGGSPQQTALTTSGVVTILRCGQVLDYVTPNQYGALAYLWTTGTPAGIVTGAGTTTYNMFDALTGQYILSVVNGSAMTMTEDQGGDLIGYYINSTTATAPRLGEWNSTQCVEQAFYGASAAGWEWRPTQNGIAAFSLGVMWTSPIPTTLNGVALPSIPVFGFGYLNGGVVVNSGVICLQAAGTSGVSDFEGGYAIELGYSTTTGQMLWITNRTEAPFARVVVAGADGNGVFAEVTYETNTVVGYSLYTGKQLWVTNLPDPNPYDSIGGYQSIVANGVIYMWSFGGNIYAISTTNGTIIWHTDTNALSGFSGSDTPYGVWPLWTFTCGSIADGMLFVPEGHMYSPPLFRGASELAVNLATGKLVWSILGFDTTSGPAISDGIMATINSYDNQIYAFGMGPSKTTVNAPDVGVTTATPVTITGTVTDISPGAQQKAVAANYPNGLPCVSDSSMTPFMEAVYMQQPMPTNITGVPVTIAVTDKNNNCYNIGTVMTDPNGFYSLNWIPIISGNFTVTATFAGTQSYYGSSANSAFYASSPATTIAPTSTPNTGVATQTTLMYGIVAIIIVIIIIGAVIMLMLSRKRP